MLPIQLEAIYKLITKNASGCLTYVIFDALALLNLACWIFGLFESIRFIFLLVFISIIIVILLNRHVRKDVFRFMKDFNTVTSAKDVKDIPTDLR